MLHLLSYQKLTIIINVLLPPSLPSHLVINPFQIQPSLHGMILINEQSSFSIPPLTEKLLRMSLGHTTAHANLDCFRDCLQQRFCERSILCVILFASIKMAPPTVSDYGGQFKGICAKLAAYWTTLLDEMDQASLRKVMRCFSNLFMVRPHLLLLSFLNKAVLDLHSDVNNANKTTLEGVVAPVTQMGVEDVGAGIPLTASYVTPMGTMPPLVHLFILMPRMLLHQMQTSTSHHTLSA
ncbi:hypothetical protein Tco_1104729 [Tanacetum coccineum]